MFFMILFFIIAPYVLGIAWMIIFWLASFMFYAAAWILALAGIEADISGDHNVWALFMVVCGIAWYVYAIGGFAGALFIFLTGAFMLFRSADMWRISG